MLKFSTQNDKKPELETGIYVSNEGNAQTECYILVNESRPNTYRACRIYNDLSGNFACLRTFDTVKEAIEECSSKARSYKYLGKTLTITID